MSPRFFSRDGPAVLPGFTGCLNGVDDPCIARAAAQMTRERSRHSLAIARATLPQQRCCTHNNPGDAEAALDRPFEHERFTQYAAYLVGGALERDHLPAFHLFRLAQ